MRQVLDRHAAALGPFFHVWRRTAISWSDRNFAFRLANAACIGINRMMIPDHTKAAREILAFYIEAGVDTPLGEEAIDRFAEPAAMASQPAVDNAPAVPRHAPMRGT